MQNPPATVLLVDGHSLIHRAFHALPPLSVGGVFTNAVQGFFSMLFKAIADYRPDALCVMFDLHAPTFRHTMYDAYKAGRKPTPEELRPQFPIIREILTAMGVTICELEGYEADDLLGTAATLANQEGIHAYILTGDRDSLQLINRHTQVILTKTGISESLLLSPEAMRDIYGYGPEQVTDMKGLMGDSSDNIPGVPGVGEKTALKLITQYGTLEKVLEHAQDVPGKLGERLRENREKAELSKDLGTIRTSAPLAIRFDDCGLTSMLQGIPTMQKYHLNRLSQQLTSLLSTDVDKAFLPPRPSTAADSRNRKPKPVAGAPAPLRAEEPPTQGPAPIALTDTAAIQTLAQALLSSKAPISLYLGESAIGLAVADGRSWYAPLLLDITTPGLYEEQILVALQALLREGVCYTHGAKTLLHRLARHKLPLPAIGFDTLVAAYLLEPTHKGFTLPEALLALQGATPEAPPEAETDAPAPAKGKKALPPPEAPEKAAELAAGIFPLAAAQSQRLTAQGMLTLLTDMEMPLTRVLFAMEQEGFSVDKAALAELGALFTAQIEQCRAAVIAATGGEEFNVNSPKQLGEVLFDRLGLVSPQRKGKNGAWSTSAEVLEALEHPAIEPLLQYRKLTKLMGTYIEGLSKLVDKSGRIHTTFDQTGTVTGRISSIDPNLQNIPVRSEEGREIRKAFVAKEGCLLLDADYSQIELRVLAHLSGDPAMQDAFRKGQDIHTRTASEIGGVPFESVTPAMRRSAKAVNFGIVYGISGFGLARNIGVTRKEADAFIAMYFERYPMVKTFMETCVRNGYELGYAETLFHRRRDLFELRSGNRNLRSFGERAAMNTPVQGTAADIIKLAMVRVQHELAQGGYAAKLILQVHDELVVECPLAELDAVSRLLQNAMEQIVTLSVPLVAEVSSGKSWYDAK